MKPIAIVLSCEHAVNTIPDAFAHYFSKRHELLQTHRGIDFGAFEIASQLAKVLTCPLISAEVSRLLIDCNRSLSHPQCFSELSSACSMEERYQLIQRYYLPFRQEVERTIINNIAAGFQVWHLSIHSFTPDMNGVVRNADIGLLYNPQRATEKQIALTWQRLLKEHSKYRRVRLNYPYRGIADGFTTSLRKQFSAKEYVGIEVESNQALTRDPIALAIISHDIVKTLNMVISEMTFEAS